MGKISILTSTQREILDQIAKSEYIVEHFYLTGGTALSEYYLQHRYSEDLDFFSEQKYDTQIIVTFINELSKKYGFTYELELIEMLYRYSIRFPNNEQLKLDFSYYPGKRVEKGKKINGITIDSLLDISINKLSTLEQRYNVKDYVDLYFLFNKYSVWDLIEGARVKFNMEIEPWILGTDFLYVEKFDFLPKMIKPLTLDELKNFFRELAKKLGKKVVV